MSPLSVLAALCFACAVLAAELPNIAMFVCLGTTAVLLEVLRRRWLGRLDARDQARRLEEHREAWRAFLQDDSLDVPEGLAPGEPVDCVVDLWARMVLDWLKAWEMGLSALEEHDRVKAMAMVTLLDRQEAVVALMKRKMAYGQALLGLPDDPEVFSAKRKTEMQAGALQATLDEAPPVEAHKRRRL